jgi:adenylosuccinate lyase
MRANIDLTRGLIFSGQLLLDLSAAGMLREEAYRVVQEHAMRAWENGGDFQAAIVADPLIRQYLDDAALEKAFSVTRQLRHVGNIFARVFDS